jgi:hypothetical protein
MKQELTALLEFMLRTVGASKDGDWVVYKPMVAVAAWLLLGLNEANPVITRSLHNKLTGRITLDA